jgi:hypothetical protein
MVGFGGGGQTVTLVQHITSGVDELGTSIMDEIRTDIPGCRHRPMVPGSARGAGLVRAEKEPETGVSVATSWWQTTIPMIPTTTAALMALQADDSIEVGGVVYQIVGNLHPFTDATGKVTKMTIHSERQTGA